jgi:ComF family protein
MSLSSVVLVLSELLAPSLCAACDLEVLRGAAFCPACEPSLLADDRGPGRHAAAFEYGGALARAITRFKYEGQAWLAPTLGALAATGLGRVASPFDVVTHVPLHPRRLAERGFDQSALLAREVARAAQKPLQYAWVTRVRDTGQQARLDRDARRLNVMGAFRADLRKSASFAGCSVLLVDDVRTTGATMFACAQALLAAGVSQVQTLALARDV